MPDGYIQIGVTALRDPATGDYLPAVPLYIKETPEAIKSKDKMASDFGRLMAGHMRMYLDGVGAPSEPLPRRASGRK